MTGLGDCAFEQSHILTGTMYRCEAVSVEGFVQQLAVQYVQHGHIFYVVGTIPERKDPRLVDVKLIKRYGIDVSRATRSRRRRADHASVHYLRHGKFFVLIATHGKHGFFEEESGILDIRETPLCYGGYSISYRRGVDRRWHASVRIAREEYHVLKRRLVATAVALPLGEIADGFWRIRFEPYAPIRRQLFNILRFVNRARKASGLERVPIQVIRMRRRVVKPFGGLGVAEKCA